MAAEPGFIRETWDNNVAERTEGGKGLVQRLARFAWMPVPLLFLIVVVLSMRPEGPILGMLPLLPVFNLAFLTLVCILVAVLAARSYLINGSPTFLFLGSGILAYGLTSLLASFSVPAGDFNTGATIYYLGVPLAGFFCLLSVFWLQASTGRRLFRPSLAILVATYAAVLAAVTAIYLFAAHGLLPTFFVEGVGPTALRETMLGVAFIGFAGTSLLIFMLERRNHSVFLDWYALGLALIAVGLLGAISYKNYDSLLAWVGRGCHYLGGIYLLVALVATMSRSGRWVVPLTALQETYDRYTRLVDTSPDAILVLAKGRIVFANPAATRLFGVTTTESVLGLHLLDLIHPASRSRVEDFLGTLFSEEKAASSLEAKVQHRSGPAVDVEMVAVPVTDWGHPAVQVVLRDISERKRSVEKISRSEVQLKEAQRLAKVGNWEWTIDGDMVTWSDELYDIAGLSREKPAPSFAEHLRFYSEESFARLEKAVRDALETGEPYELLLELIRTDGTPRWVEAHGEPVRDEKGRIVGLHGTVQDITERKRAEQALRESEDKYRALFQSSFDAVIIALPDGSIESANAEACRIFGKTEEEIIRGGRDGIADKNDPRWPAFIEERERTGRSKGELNYRRKDGTIFPGEASSAFFRDWKSRTKVAIIIRDITARKRAEEALRESKARLEAVFSSMNDGVIIFDADGKATSANAAAARYHRFTDRNDFFMSLGGYAETFDTRSLDGTPLNARDWPASRALGGEVVYNQEMVVTNRESGESWIGDYSAAPIWDEQGNIVAAVVTMRDATERKRTEAELAQAKAQVELYLDLMGHDINNYNQVALGYLELLNGMVSDPALKEFAAKPMEAIASSSRLIENVRKLQKASTGQYKAQAVDLVEVLSGLRAQYSAVAGNTANIRFDHDSDCIAVADGLIKDVFANLIGNAIKHSNGNGPTEVAIRLTKTDDDGKTYCRVAIDDNGPGIPDAMKGKLFHRFQRGNTQAGGKGLGLYLVRSLVEGYGGKVWVEDRVPGDYMKGARFVVMLPVVEK